MSKRTEDLAFKYNINASVDELSLFVSEVYNEGYHDGKAFKERYITIRDHFAGLAMQSLYLSGVEWETTGKERDEGSLAVIKELACDAYQLADAMLKAREAEGRKTHCINYDEIEQLLAQPEQPEPVYWENEKKALLNEIDHLTNRLAQPELSTDSLQLDEQEPVAWKVNLIDHFQSLYDTEMLRTDEGEYLILLEDAICAVEEWSPSKREPLSYDARMELWYQTGQAKELLYRLHEYAIAVEKHHGIGVDDE